MQRSEARDRVADLPRDLSRVGQVRQRTTDGPLVVVGDDVVDEPADFGRIAGRVQPATAYQLAHLLLDDTDRIHVPAPDPRTPPRHV